VRKEEEKKPKRLGSEQPKLSSVWHTGLSGGAPDSVRCARLSPVKRPLLGKDQRRMAIIHRLSGGAPDFPVSQRSPVQWSAAQSAGDAWPAPTVGRGHRTVQCAPDCPVCTGQCRVRHQARSCNGQLRLIWKSILHRTATGTVRWCTGLSGAPHDTRQD
jgi:hypothetical protein